MASERTPAELLATPVQYLKGVGPQRAELLERLGLRTARDLLFFFPRDYQDLTDRREVANLEEGKLQSVRGVVEDIELRATGVGRSLLGVLVHSGNGYLRALWFNQPFLRERFFIGQHVLVSGKARRDGLMWQMSHPQVETLADDEEEPPGRILPVYPSTEGLQQWQIRRMVRGVLASHAGLVDEVFPAEYLEAHDLWPLARALAEIHVPSDHESLARARGRFVYQELLVLQLALAVRRQQQREAQQAPRLERTERIDARIRRLIPFRLTAGQEQAIAEISADLAEAAPMNRLLQGDVGSGKTMVAAYAMLLAVAHGFQAVLMAPTEVLARQHALTLSRMLSLSQVRVGQLSGGLTAKARRALLEGIAAGAVEIVVGTQAVIQEDVQFARLGLVVIDEQHRFGVRQRATLKQAGAQPHYLVMTATPIPRSVALTVFGDLDLSVLKDSPPGRQPVHTYLVSEERRPRWWKFFGERLREGRQGYVVVPLVEDSEEIQAASLEASYEQLANGPLEAFRLNLLHGRMNAAEKDAIMDEFREGRTQVLVCTSVVEVGVDVPNATVMAVEGAERFGLAQLHQFRGRISRGRFPGYCGVFAETNSPEAIRRLEAFVSTTDGFRLAELDFELRGPGELLGLRQHGLPPFRIADLVRDAGVVEEARRDAQELVAKDPGLRSPAHARLRRMVLVRYGQALDLGDVG